jgi:hypothetical protein
MRFGSLREYLLSTTHLESPILYDSISEQIPSQPLGPLSLANCACGTTLTINSRGLPTVQLIELLEWARIECCKRSVDVRELLRHLRARIDSQVLQEDKPWDSL